MRKAMAMIELIFAIVIIAISIISIPSMLSVAEKASKISIIDDDIMSRMMGWVIDKSQARWDGNYSASQSPILWVNGTDLNCSRGSGNVWYRDNNDSTVQCHENNVSASAIPAPGDGNLSRGIEQLNGGSETLSVTASTTGETYDITASYAVRYVDSTIGNGTADNRKVATWRLGSSTNMAPDGTTGTQTHLKRIVTRFNDPETGTDTVLTFFKSNKGN